jgi:uncharacterized protein (TIGR04255 family)
VSALSTPPFPNAPLVLTVLEIRYPELDEGVGRRAKHQMRDALRKQLPLVENVTEEQVEVAIGAPMPAMVQRRNFPRFTTRDRTTALVVKEQALVLETTVYEGWEESFRPLITSVVRAFAQTSSPDGVLRIGLRYIDEIRIPKVVSLPGDWHAYIDRHLLAPASSDFLPASLKPTVWQGLVQYKTASDSTLTVRYGPQDGHAVDPRGSTRRKNPPLPGPFFLLDSDSFWQPSEEVPAFDADSILAICDSLHEPTREFFRIAVTDKLRDEVFNAAKESVT